MSAFIPFLRLRVLLVAGIIAITSLSVCQSAIAQTTAPNEWTWIDGNNALPSTPPGVYWPGVYGTQGIPASGNNPGSREYAVSWTDKNGHFWLFGGNVCQSISSGVGETCGALNDLWEFNRSTNEWAWMGGSSTINQPGEYGTLGSFTAGSIPGARYEAINWTDGSGHLWLFGGHGLDANGDDGYLNDLWEFDPSTNLWAWMGGSNAEPNADSGLPTMFGHTGVYGTLGTPGVGNIPGGRYGATSWTDGNGNLWLFGGFGYDSIGNTTATSTSSDSSGGVSYLDDLWEFNPSTNLWTWMGGSSVVENCNQGVCGLPGVYGTLGTPGAGNIPGSRVNAVGWTDSSGNLWLFGGFGWGSESGAKYGDRGDLWEFNPFTNEWTWMGGSSIVNPSGVYGTLGTPGAGNIPGGRESATSWTDSDGNLWLFGGFGIDSTVFSVTLNDLWEFDPSSKEWTWMGGSSKVGSKGGEPGVYGTLGTPGAGNVPGGREGATSWTDSNGNLWLFGGEGFDAKSNLGYLNDFWEYQPTAVNIAAKATPTVTVTLSASSITLAQAQPLTVTVVVSGTPIPTGSVTLSGGDYISPPSTLTSGGVTFTVPAASLAVGADTLTVLYTPDGASFSTYNSASGTNVVTVSKETSSTKLISSPNPSSFGELVTLTATVTGQYGGMATGTVTFSNGSTTLGTVPVNGSAVFTITALPRGSDSITAVYNGDAQFYGSKSNTISQVVNAEVLHDWTWMGGSSTVGSNGGQSGVYGLVGTAAIGNVPGGRDGAASWSDSSGHLWLFGGEGYDANGVLGYPNDLWKFNSLTNEWTWMSGSSTVPCSSCAAIGETGLNGDFGMPAPELVPGGRAGSSSWIDGSGNLWLFGGFVLSVPNKINPYGNKTDLNDIWEFNPVTNEWAWMGGGVGTSCYTGPFDPLFSSECGMSGDYGTLGTPAASTAPGSRDSSMSWIDSGGNLWLFGGWGYDVTGHSGYLNDLWEFNPSIKEWTWMGGGSVLTLVPGANGPYYSMPGVYGTLGKPASTNIPSGREGSKSWIDSSGNFWLYGGAVPTTDGGLYELSDLWEFNPSTKEWTWMGGSTATDQAGVYGTLGTPAVGNTPGGRALASSWTDSSGNVRLFGGQGFDANCSSCDLNDLWEFNSSTNYWAWAGGSSTAGNTSGVYGELGTPAAGNIPGSRSSAISWTDGSGNLWLFGGNGYDANATSGYLNDMWEYKPAAATTPVKTATTTALTSESNPSTYEESVTLTASVSSIAGVPPNEEIVTFMSGATTLGTAPLTSGVASLTTKDLLAGTNSITAVYSGDTNFAGSASTAVSQVVNKETSSVTIWPTASSITYGQTLASSILSGGVSTPVGSFAFTTPTTAPHAGIASQSVTFTPTNSTEYSTLTGTTSVTVDKANPSVTIWPTASSITYGQTLASSTLSGGVSTPAGSFAFTTPTTAPNAGTASQSVTFTPTDTTDYSTLMGTASVTVGKASSSTALFTSVNPSTVGQSVNLTASLTGQYGGTATGTVTFSNESTSLGSIPLSGDVAVLTTTALSLGTDTITAVYSGDSNFTGSTSNTVSQVVTVAPNPLPVLSSLSPAFASAGATGLTLTVTGSGFTTGSTVYWGNSALTTTYGSATQLTAQVSATDIARVGVNVITVQTPTPGGGTSNVLQFEVDSVGGTATEPTFTPATASVTAGSAASYSVRLPSTVESASASCLNLPTGATCSYSTTSNTLTITTSSTTPKGTYPITVVFTETVSGAATSWILLPILLLPLVFARRKLAARCMWMTICLGFLLAAAGCIVGCGGGGASTTPTPQTHQVVSSGSVVLTIQ